VGDSGLKYIAGLSFVDYHCMCTCGFCIRITKHAMDYIYISRNYNHIGIHNLDA
jgi:hypothetical protein